jgi:hypothetical protein
MERDTNEFTPAAGEKVFLLDEKGRDLLVVVVKRTFQITQRGLIPSEEQRPVDLAGECYGEPGKSSYRYEPEIAPPKPATDIVLIGHAHASKSRQTEIDVTIRVGALAKTVRIFGDRFWDKLLGMETMTPPRPFEKIPLMYERAFGGWDRTPADPEQYSYEPRNPVGSGYRDRKRGKFVEGLPLPNLEEPRHLIRNSKDAPPPAGFGFIGPDWTPRRNFCGTYDEKWASSRAPLLPDDFDRRFYNAAHPDLIVPGRLRGDEAVDIANVSPNGTLRFNLPGEAPPRVRVEMRGGARTIPTALDTVIINTDEGRVYLLWRASLDIHGRVDDVRAIALLQSNSSQEGRVMRSSH